MTKINLAFYFPFNKSMTGGPRTLVTFMELIDRDKYQPVVITQKQSPLVEELANHNIEVVIFPLPSLLSPQDKQVLKYSIFKKTGAFKHLISYNRNLTSFLKERNIQLIWTRSIKGVLLIGFAAFICRITLIWDIALGEAFRGWMKPLHFIGLNLASVVVTEGKSQHKAMFGNFLSRIYRKKLRAIMPGIGPDRIKVLHQISKDAKTLPSGFTILNIGTISPRKNQKMLIEATKRLVKQHRNIKVYIVGPPVDTSYYEELIALINENELSAYISFLGWRDDIPQLLKTADLLVVCSENEGIPHVIYEAMHAAIPVVATTVGGITDAVQHGETGFLIALNDVKDLSEKIQYFIQHPAEVKRIGANGERFAQTHFTYQAYYQNYDHLITELVHSH